MGSFVYSTYEAKARFSEIMRRVREGHHLIITYHGRQVAEIRPVTGERQPLSEHLASLRQGGLLAPRAARRGPLQPLASRPGALERFLQTRE